MTTILHIAVSPKGEAAHSFILASELIARLRARHAPAREVTRRFDRDPPAYPDAAYAAAMVKPATARSAQDVANLVGSEALIGELETADVLVISTPMHNFTVPATLKSWLDQIVRIGRTFDNLPEGKCGRLADRPAYVVVSSGGFIAGERARQPDFLTPYLTEILATIGIRDVRFVRVETASRGETERARAYAEARAQIDALFPHAPA